jgi:predicted metal-dependent phosphoesterase TrpH
MLRVEFHCHTEYSIDSFSRIENVIKVCRKRGISRLVVTDHNTILGALAAKQLDPELIIVGEEIKTEEGELLAAYVKENIPEGLPPLEAVRILQEQEAFISVSHPFDTQRGATWRDETLEQIVPFVDSLEVFNSRCIDKSFNWLAQEYADKHNLPGTVGSDAHSLGEIGRSTFSVPDFNDAHELRKVIRQARYSTRYSGIGVRLFSTTAHIYKKHTGWQLPVPRQ